MAADLYGQRRRALAAEFGERKLDALLVSFLPNVRYLTGFTGSNGQLLVSPDGATLYTDPRYRLQAARETTCRVRVCNGQILPRVVEEMNRQRIRRLGFEKDRVSYASYEKLRAELPMRASLEPVAGWIEERRMVKSPGEIELIRRSVQTNSQAFEEGIRHARPGVAERELAAELDYRMRRLGAEKPAFDTLVAAGERSALVHAQPSAAVLPSRGLVLIDMGAVLDGYASDMTRMLHVGRPTARVQRTYRSVLEAQAAALSAVRPGVTAAHVDRQARSVLRGYGLDRAFVHSTGHGLGLEIHEAPRLGRKDRTRLAAGMCLTLEPGVYIEGWGGIRIEDTVLVTPQGGEILTPTVKELWRI